MCTGGVKFTNCPFAGVEQRGDAQQSLVVVVQGPVKAHHLLIYSSVIVFTELSRGFPRKFERHAKNKKGQEIVWNVTFLRR